MRAVNWTTGGGFHPKANATTLRVAEDLARRMDYTTGHVVYDLDRTCARLDISRATLKRHVRILREAGLLAWHTHGNRTNRLRTLGRPGYSGTATIYAATIPRSYDHAMGHRLAGEGFTTRVVGYTEAGRQQAIHTAQQEAEARRLEGREPPSLTGTGRYGKAEVSGWLKDTRVDASALENPPRRKRSARRRGTGRHPLQVARDIRTARHVRPLVNWTQRESLRRLAFALRPLIDQGLDAHDIAAELHAWMLDWRPARPAAYIQAVLRHRDRRDAAHPPPDAPAVPPNEAFLDALTTSAGTEHDQQEQQTADPLAHLTPDEITDMRHLAATHPSLVTLAIETLGEHTARRLYTNRIVDTALLHEFGSPNLTVH